MANINRIEYIQTSATLSEVIEYYKKINTYIDEVKLALTSLLDVNGVTTTDETRLSTMISLVETMSENSNQEILDYTNQISQLEQEQEEILQEIKDSLTEKGTTLTGEESFEELLEILDKMVIVKGVEKLPPWFIFNPTFEDMWIIAKDMTTARDSLTSSVVDNKIYCIGGYSSSVLNENECYDPSTNLWSTKAPMTTKRYDLTSSVVDNKIYCIGGNNGEDHLNKNQCYNPSTDTWTSKIDMTTARSRLTSSVVNNLIYCIGGTGTSTYTNKNECYDPSTNTWSTKKAMTTARYGLTSSVVNNKIYVIGGYNGNALKLNQCYDPSTNTWSAKATMPAIRYNLTSSVVNNKIYVIGGYDDSSYLDTNECYDPSTDTWSTKKAMTTARHWLTSSVVNGAIYAIGGSTDIEGSSPFVTNECYIP